MTEIRASEIPFNDRYLTEIEWQGLLSDPAFVEELIIAIKEEISRFPYHDSFLVIRNWPIEAHHELFKMHPDLASAFNLSASFPAEFVEGRGWNFCGEESGARQFCATLVDGPLGFDETRLTPYGEPWALDPYADITTAGWDPPFEEG